MKKGKSIWTHLLRIGLSAAFLIFLYREAGGKQILVSMREADVGLLLLAWLLFLVGIIVRVFRWQALLHGLGMRPPLGQLVKLYFIGGFFNLVLPSGFGGDVVRVLELRGGATGAAERGPAAFGTVLVDRMTGILSSMVLDLVVVPFAQGLPPAVAWLVVLVSLAGLAGGALLLEGNLLRKLTSRLPAAVSLAGEGKLAQIYAAITGSGRRALWLALGLSTVFNLLNIAVYWLGALAVGIDLPFTFHVVIVPLLSLTLLLPISVGGLGARDWVGQLLVAPTGIPDTMTAAWTLSVWAVSAAAGAIGGLVYLWDGLIGFLRSRQQEREAPGVEPGVGGSE